MTFLTIVRVPGVTREKYEAVNADALPEGETVEGLQAHVARPTEEGVQVIEVWDSRDDFMRFSEECFAPVAEKHDLPDLETEYLGPAWNVVVG
jgi:heme-degrading monooxygenase HmoA